MVKENKKKDSNSGSIQLLEVPENKPTVAEKEETKPVVKQKKETKPAVKSKNETKPVVKQEKETKPAVVETKESKPAVIKEKTESVLTQTTKSEAKNVYLLFGVLVGSFLLLLLLIFLIFAICVNNNKNIHNGVYIKNVDVSGMNKQSAKDQISLYIANSIPEEIILKHGDFETAIPTSSLNIKFDIDGAVETAYSIGRSGNFISNGFEALGTMIVNKNVEPSFTIDEKALEDALNDISTKLPDKLIDSGYYIEDNELILNKGSIGNIINTKQMSKSIKDEINKLNLKGNKIVMLTNEVSPKKLDIDEIYNKVHIEPTNASFTAEPRTFTPSKNGIDFAVSIDEAKQKLAEAEKECVIPLKVVYPSINNNMISEEAFPDVLSEYSTYYYESNYNRTTNLKLAAAKINGTVLMPGEEFSYNDVVGERTIAAGYKEAPIYVSGRVEDGLGGGICQITTTLYNAAVYANLEITDRSNHQFVPSYVTAGLDATVAYGSVDFKFKNNRNYPIKIVCSVADGVAYFKILGLRTPDDYDVEIYARVTGQSARYTNSETYKILYKDGNVVEQVLLSRDTYMRH